MVKFFKNPYVAILGVIVLLANSPSHPTNSGGFTGAPGDSVCAQCHSGNNGSFAGDILIEGVPATIEAGQTYPITVTLENTNTNISRGGFQITALTESNAKAGDFSSPGPSSSIKTSAGRQYFGHAPAVSFNGANQISWTVNWKAPLTGSGDITFYGAAIQGNGSGSSGDRMVLTNTSGTFSGGSMPLTASIIESNDVTCFGANDGNALAAGNGGQPNYTYSWSSGQNTALATNLSPGTKTVTITDGAGNTATASVVINQPPVIGVNLVNSNNPSCYNTSDGSATIEASGGTGTLTYLWSNGDVTPLADNLGGGNHTVTVTDFNNCQKTLTITLTTPPAIATGPIIKENPSCFGGSNGSIQLSPSGGSGTLTTNWSNGASGNYIQGLAAGSYIYTISDANGCENTGTVVLTNPNPLNVQTSITNALICSNGNNGAIQAIPSGGTAGYSYLWSNGGNTQIINNLNAGIYSVVVTDSEGCTKTSSISLIAPPPISTSVSSSTNASCIGIANGSVTVVSSGGSQPYSYQWENGNTGATLANVTAGSYQLTVSDNNACTSTFIASVGSNDNASLSLVSTTNLSCFGNNNGSITISASNANGYTINWSNGASGLTINNLTAGSYTAIASNPAGCMSPPLVTNITSPPQIINSPLISNITCFGQSNGAINPNYSGGTGALAYLWSNGSNQSSISNLGPNTYSITVTDQNGCSASSQYILVSPNDLVQNATIVNLLCYGSNSGSIIINLSGGSGNVVTNWSNGVQGLTNSNLPAGSYIATSTDSLGCIEADTFQVIQPNEIQSNPTIVNENPLGANNGSIAVNPSGGSVPYTYLWSNGDTNSTIDSLMPGIYSLTISDNNGCQKIQQYNVQSGGCALAVNFSVNNVSCNGGNDGQVLFDIMNGQPPYMVTPEPKNLSSGTYNFNIADAAGCGFIVSNVSISQPPVITINLDTVINASSQSVADGKAFITCTGGIGQFNYQWKDDKGNIISTSQNLINVLHGIYSIEVKDNNNCTKFLDSVIIGFTSGLNVGFNDKIKVYPNPFDDLLTVEGIDKETSILIFNEVGQQVYSSNGENVISLKSLNPGMYFLSLANEKFKYQKLVFKK